MTLDAGDEQLVGICLRVMHEVRGRLLSGDSNEGNTLVSRLEPDNLGAFNRATRLVTAITFTLTALSLLLLLGRCGRWTQQAQGTGEELSGHTLDNGDDVTGELRLHFVRDPVSK